MCASQFLPSCGLLAEKLYYCGALGDLPTEVGDCKTPSICEVKEDVGTCKPPTDPCNCPLDGTATTVRHHTVYFPITTWLSSMFCFDCWLLFRSSTLWCAHTIPLCSCNLLSSFFTQICGSNFETKCGLEPDSVYDCKDRAGRKPVKVTSCAPQACVPGKNSAECAKDPCRCTAAKITVGVPCPSPYSILFSYYATIERLLILTLPIYYIPCVPFLALWWFIASRMQLRSQRSLHLR